LSAATRLQKSLRSLYLLNCSQSSPSEAQTRGDAAHRPHAEDGLNQNLREMPGAR
jgi:hypothetical protein